MIIKVSYCARTEESAKSYAQVIKDNMIPTPVYRVDIEEGKHQYAEGREGESYYMAEIVIWPNEATDIAEILGQIDNVKQGFFEVEPSISQDLFGDMDVKVDNSSRSIDATNSLANHLHDKSQTQDSLINHLEDRIAHQAELIELQSQSIKQLEENYRALLVWLHTSINLNEMKRVVVELAETVDDDILDNFKFHKIH